MSFTDFASLLVGYVGEGLDEASMGVLKGVDWNDFSAGIEIDPDEELEEEEEVADVEDVH